MPSAARPRIGFLWGDFPWSEPPPKVGKLLSMGAVARIVARALAEHGTVVPYIAPPPAASQETRQAALAAFLAEIDVLWADLYPASGPALQIRHDLGLRCPALLFAGGTLPKGAEAMLFPWQGLVRPDDALLFTCQADRAIWHQLVARSTLREWVVPLAVDETVFHPGEPGARAAIRARPGLPPAAPLLLVVGRLNIQKNLHGALRLLAAVRRVVPDAQLCFVGEEDDIVLGEFGVRNTGYVAWLRALAADLGLADAVIFTGPRFGTDLVDLYSAADLLVNLSVYHRENFDLAAAEAAACGLPAICSAWGGFKDVVRHGETGYLVDTVLTKHGVRVDWAAGADHAVALLRDRTLHARLSAAAATQARANFSLAALSRSLGAIIQALVGIATPGDRPAYEPSDFARRYEAHKRACGWYAPKPAPGERPVWYPRMFTGTDYALYETLMAPYATRLAHDLAPEAIAPDWTPYFPSGIVLDPIRQLARNLDPIWPHQRHLTPAEWALITRIDGSTTVAELDRHTPAAPSILWHLYIEGFLLFHKPIQGCSHS
jgi:glycosyltransferase involved in cell wall biosynthesis